jgi:YidC/Oxa1 family membrane protein insertase
MDKTGIIVVSVCVLLLGLWFYEQQKEAVRWQEQQRQFALTNQTIVPSPAVPPTPAAVPPATAWFNARIPEQTIVLTNSHARYTFTSRGGGLEKIELLGYPQTIAPGWKKTKTAGESVASLNARAPLPILAVLGGTNLIGDGVFTLTRTDDGVRAEKQLPNGLRMVKEFHLSSNYLVQATVRLENPTDHALAVPSQEWVVGTAAPMGPDDKYFSYYGGVMWFDGQKTLEHPPSWFNTNTTYFGIFHRTPTTEYIAGQSNVVWTAAHNQFFALVAMPSQPAQQIIARPVPLPPFPGVEPEPGAPPPEGVETLLAYPAQTLTAHSDLTRQVTLYAGPKEYRLLAKLGAAFHNDLDQVIGFDLVPPFYSFGGFFAKILLLAMNWLHDVTRWGYGVLIILLTVILKILFWPFTAASIRSAKKMQALAPQINALREKYKDDPQKLTQKQLELWRANKVSPVSGCLPMLVQMPVFIGFYTMLRSAIELRGAHFLWVADLSKPDTLFVIPGLTFIPFLSTPEGLPFNLLPWLMGAAMLWQSHSQPPSPGMDPTQQKLMRWMPAIFILFLYNYSSGLALYWTVNNVLSVVQTRLTKNMVASAPAPAPVPAAPPKKKR